MAQRQSTNVRRRQLTPAELDRLRIALGGDFISLGASPLVGGIDTATYRLDARTENGEEVTMVLRCFRGPERTRSAERVRHERALLDAIAPHFGRAPRPLVADPSGDLLGEPLVILTWATWTPGATTENRRSRCPGAVDRRVRPSARRDPRDRAQRPAPGRSARRTACETGRRP